MAGGKVHRHCGRSVDGLLAKVGESRGKGGLRAEIGEKPEVIHTALRNS